MTNYYHLSKSVINTMSKPLPLTEFKHDIRQIMIQRIKIMNRQYILQKAGINHRTEGAFLNERGGMDFHSGIRWLISAGYKIIDDKGKVILGDPDNRTEELNHNTLIKTAL